MSYRKLRPVSRARLEDLYSRGALPTRDDVRGLFDRLDVMVAALKEAEELLALCGPSAERVRGVAALGVSEDPPVLALCERYGYGAVMDSAARQWAAICEFKGHNYTTGPSGACVERGLRIIRGALRGHRR